MSWVGVELDPTTAAICPLLYPHADIRAEGFETTDLPDGSVDAVVGNVPFGKVALLRPAPQPRPASPSTTTSSSRRSTCAGPAGSSPCSPPATRSTPATRRPAPRCPSSPTWSPRSGSPAPPTAPSPAPTSSPTSSCCAAAHPTARPPTPEPGGAPPSSTPADGPVAVNEWFVDHPDLILGHPDARRRLPRRRPAGHRRPRPRPAAARPGRRSRRRQRPRPHHTAAIQQPDPPAGTGRGRRPATRSAGRKPGAIVELADRQLRPRHRRPRVEPFDRAGVGPSRAARAVRPPRRAHRRSSTSRRRTLRRRQARRAATRPERPLRRLHRPLRAAQPVHVGPHRPQRPRHRRRVHAPPAPEDGRVPRRPRRAQRVRPRSVRPGHPGRHQSSSVHPTGPRPPTGPPRRRRAGRRRRWSASTNAAASTSTHVADLLGIDDSRRPHRARRPRVRRPRPHGQLDPGRRLPVRRRPHETRRRRRSRRRSTTASASTSTPSTPSCPSTSPPTRSTSGPASHGSPSTSSKTFLRRRPRRARPHVAHDPLTATWELDVPRLAAPAVTMTSEWGTDRKDAVALLQAACQQQPRHRLRRGRRPPRPATSKPPSTPARNRTQLARPASPPGCGKTPPAPTGWSTIYNERFNTHVARSYDGSHLTLPGLAATLHTAGPSARRRGPHPRRTVGAARPRGRRRQDRHDGHRGDGAAPARAGQQADGRRAEPHARAVLHRVARRCTRQPRCCSRPKPNKARPAANGSSPEPRWGNGTPSSSPSRCSNASRSHPRPKPRFIDRQVDALRERSAAHFEATIGRRSRTVKDIELRVLKLEERQRGLLHRADKDDGATFEQTRRRLPVRRRGPPRQEPGHHDPTPSARQVRAPATPASSTSGCNGCASSTGPRSSRSPPPPRSPTRCRRCG